MKQLESWKIWLVSQINQPFWKIFWHLAFSHESTKRIQNQLPELGWEISTKMPQVKLFLGWDPNEP